jgi:hypothetical protein
VSIENKLRRFQHVIITSTAGAHYLLQTELAPVDRRS